MRAGAFERHLQACPECRGGGDGGLESALCREAWRLALAVDQAKEQVEQLTEAEIWAQLSPSTRA
jgi:hypothetical protein